MMPPKALLSAWLALALALPSPAYALRPAGLEEASPSLREDFTRALDVPAAGLEERLGLRWQNWLALRGAWASLDEALKAEEYDAVRTETRRTLKRLAWRLITLGKNPRGLWDRMGLTIQELQPEQFRMAVAFLLDLADREAEVSTQFREVIAHHQRRAALRERGDFLALGNLTALFKPQPPTWSPWWSLVIQVPTYLEGVWQIVQVVVSESETPAMLTENLQILHGFLDQIAPESSPSIWWLWLDKENIRQAFRAAQALAHEGRPYKVVAMEGFKSDQPTTLRVEDAAGLEEGPKTVGEVIREILPEKPDARLFVLPDLALKALYDGAVRAVSVSPVPAGERARLEAAAFRRLAQHFSWRDDRWSPSERAELRRHLFTPGHILFEVSTVYARNIQDILEHEWVQRLIEEDPKSLRLLQAAHETLKEHPVWRRLFLTQWIQDRELADPVEFWAQWGWSSRTGLTRTSWNAFVITVRDRLRTAPGEWPTLEQAIALVDGPLRTRATEKVVAILPMVLTRMGVVVPSAGLEEPQMLEVVRRLYQDDQQVIKTSIRREVDGRSDEVPVTTVHGITHRYVLAGRFLFVDPEEWAAHREALGPYQNAVIVTTMRQHGFAGIWDFLYGSHTRMAVTLLQDPRYAEEVIRGRVGFDAGTGDGVLATLAARLGAAHIYAMDWDARAIEQARAHLEENGVADRVTLLLGRFAELEQAFRPLGGVPHLDFVLANLGGNGLYKVNSGVAMRSWHVTLRDQLIPRWYFLFGATGERDEEADGAKMVAGWMAQESWQLLEARHDETWPRPPIPRAFVLQRPATVLEEYDAAYFAERAAETTNVRVVLGPTALKVQGMRAVVKALGREPRFSPRLMILPEKASNERLKGLAIPLLSVPALTIEAYAEHSTDRVMERFAALFTPLKQYEPTIFQTRSLDDLEPLVRQLLLNLGVPADVATAEAVRAFVHSTAGLEQAA